MIGLPELMFIHVTAQRLSEYARLHRAGEFLTYLLDMVVQQAEMQYSLALRLSEVQAAIDSADAIVFKSDDD